MNDPRKLKPSSPVPHGLAPAKPAAAPARGPVPPGTSARPESAAASTPRSGGEGATGKVVHDDRGNAVWDWVKTTSRHAIESTTRMLRKLEAPELKMEDTKDEDLRIAPEPTRASGYDPYNQAVKPRPGRK